MNNAISSMEQELIKIRRELHQIPEVGLMEYKTATYVENKLKEFGIPHIERCLETGVVGLIPGTGGGEAIAFRADMDGLTVEEGEKEFASCHPGMMHACGHDGHMTMLLGFAKYLMEQETPPKGDVVLIFQPAEEGPGGAELMIKAGVLEKYKVKKIIGCHIFPQVPQGKVACKEGAMMARNGEVRVRIMGQSAHGAQPQLGADALLAACAVVSALHTIVSRNISPLDSGVLTFGTISGGEARNVIAKEVSIDGTMRSFSDVAYEEIAGRVEEVVKSVPRGYGCEGEVEFLHMYRVVDNHPFLVHALEEVCGENYVTCQPYMLAEDFSMFQQEIPGIFFFLGSGNTEKGLIHPLHNAKFDFDEAILCQGIEVYAKMLEKLSL